MWPWGKKTETEKAPGYEETLGEDIQFDDLPYEELPVEQAGKEYQSVIEQQNERSWQEDMEEKLKTQREEELRARRREAEEFKIRWKYMTKQERDDLRRLQSEQEYQARSADIERRELSAKGRAEAAQKKAQLKEREQRISRLERGQAKPPEVLAREFEREYKLIRTSASAGKLSELDIFELKNIVTEARSFGVDEELLRRIKMMREAIGAKYVAKKGGDVARKGLTRTPEAAARGLQILGGSTTRGMRRQPTVRDSLVGTPGSGMGVHDIFGIPGARRSSKGPFGT